MVPVSVRLPPTVTVAFEGVNVTAKWAEPVKSTLAWTDVAGNSSGVGAEDNATTNVPEVPGTASSSAVRSIPTRKLEPASIAPVSQVTVARSALVVQVSWVPSPSSLCHQSS